MVNHGQYWLTKSEKPNPGNCSWWAAMPRLQLPRPRAPGVRWLLHLWIARCLRVWTGRKSSMEIRWNDGIVRVNDGFILVKYRGTDGSKRFIFKKLSNGSGVWSKLNNRRVWNCWLFQLDTIQLFAVIFSTRKCWSIHHGLCVTRLKSNGELSTVAILHCDWLAPSTYIGHCPIDILSIDPLCSQYGCFLK